MLTGVLAAAKLPRPNSQNATPSGPRPGQIKRARRYLKRRVLFLETLESRELLAAGLGPISDLPGSDSSHDLAGSGEATQLRLAPQDLSQRSVGAVATELPGAGLPVDSSWFTSLGDPGMSWDINVVAGSSLADLLPAPGRTMPPGLVDSLFGDGLADLQAPVEPALLDIHTAPDIPGADAAHGLQLVLINNLLPWAGQIQHAVAAGAIPVLYDGASITVDGFVDLLSDVARVHGDAPIGTVAIVTHGSPAALLLGPNATLDSATLAGQPAELRQLRDLLAPEAQFEFYACSVAGSAAGQAFLNEFSQMIAANVFASTNDVGSGQLGDLTLEFGTSPTMAPRELVAAEDWESIAGLHLAPAAPTGLTAQTPTPQQLTASWNAVSGAVNYRLYRSTSPNGPWDGTTQRYFGPNRNYDSGQALTPGTTYYVAARAADSSGQATNQSGNSPLSNVVTITTPLAIPAAPAGLSVQTPTPQQVTANWNAVSGAANYRLYRSTSPSGPWDASTQRYFGPNRNYDSGQNLAAGTTYYVAVRAVNAAGQATNQSGNSPLSNVVTITTPLAIPAAPAGLSVQTPTPQQVTANWNAVSGAANYRLYRSTSPSGPWDASTQRYFGPNRNYDSGQNLAAGTTYYVAVRAVNAAGQATNQSGNSPLSNVVTITTPLAIPAAPAGLSVQTPTPQQVTANWNAVSGAANYRLYRSTSPSGPWDASTQRYFGPNRNYDSGQNLAAGTTYYVAVRAVNAAGQATNQSGNSPLSNVVTITTPLAIPAAPAGLSVQTPTPQQVTANWNAVSGAANYRLYRSTSPSGPWDASTQRYFGPNRNYDSGQNLAAGTTYYVAVRAVNAAGQATNQSGNSPLSNVVTITTPLAIPAAPAGLSVQAPTPQQVTANWNAVSGAASYRLYRSTSPSGPWDASTQRYFGPNRNYDSGQNLAAGTTYYVAVRAVNAAGQATNQSGNSPLSNVVTITTPLAIPAAPAGLSVQAPTPLQITASWSAVSGAASYRLYRSTSPSGPWDASTQRYFGPNLNYDSGQNLAAGTTYYVAVRAVNAAGQATNQSGNSPLSNVVTITTPLAIPAAPAGLSVQAPTQQQITASWNAVSGAANYRLYRSTSASGPWDASTQRYFGPNLNYDSGQSLTAGTTYYVAVRAVNAAGQATNQSGNSPLSNVVTITPSNVPVYNQPFLTDAQLVAANSMTVDQIRAFLTQRGSYFAQSRADVDAVVFDMAQVIYDAAQQYQVNPQVLLTTLQKESGAVTSGNRPSDTRLRSLMGAGAPSTARAQLAYAAQLFRSYQNALVNSGQTVSGWRVGVSKATADGVSVTPATNAVAGQFTYTPYAGAGWGGSSAGGVSLFCSLWQQFGFGGATSSAPVNNDFANRTAITGTTATVMGTNVSATKESGEPSHAGCSGGKSLWWTWTAPTAGSVQIDTIGSNFDTILGVYTGSSISSLTAVPGGSDDDSGGNYTSKGTFTAVAGTAYQIAVDGYGAGSGNITLHINPTSSTAPEVKVLGNGQDIVDNVTSSSALDGTSFGTVVQGGAAISHSFVVRNEGTATLTLGAASVPAGFTVTDTLVSSLAPGSSDTLTVRLDTASAGTKSGQISFATNDSDENPFNFSVTGTVSGTVTSTGDAFEADDAPAQAKTIPTNGTAQSHSLHVSTDVDWVTFTLQAPSDVTVETDGVAGGDTEVRLYGPNSSTTAVAYDDDSGNGYYSKIVRAGAQTLPAGTYYARINRYGSYSPISNYTLRVTALRSGWASAVIPPLDSYVVTGYGFGDEVSTGVIHTGEDAQATAGTPVYAIADGRAAWRKTDSQGYEQVFVIEHQRADGSKFISIYGHLSDRAGYQMPFQKDDTIYRGSIIGYIGWDEENGEGGPHLHFGIREGTYDGNYQGRAASTAGFLRPSDVIGNWNFNTTSISGGWTQGRGGWSSVGAQNLDGVSGSNWTMDPTTEGAAIRSDGQLRLNPVFFNAIRVSLDSQMPDNHVRLWYRTAVSPTWSTTRSVTQTITTGSWTELTFDMRDVQEWINGGEIVDMFLSVGDAGTADSNDRVQIDWLRAFHL